MQQLIDDIPRFDDSFYPLIIICIIAVISLAIAFWFKLKNIIVVFSLMCFITILLYFLGLIDLSIGIFGFLLLPFLLIFFCKSSRTESDVDG